jgi:NitT/TauT family transport system ATP-binding protein/nitrate/nitrite transport system substrate-binding protein
MPEPIRLGLLRLCDAAPVILANHEAIFAANGVGVTLLVEPSWANIADKLSYGLLDGAVMLPPLAIACAAGLRGRQTALAIPMGLSSNGNAVTLAAKWREDFAAGGIGRVATRQKLRLAVVHGFSTHDLLLRYWLAREGVDPETQVEITVVPPAEMVGSLAAGAVDGFCVGAPWGQVAAHAGLGFIATASREIWPDHPEKCLALREEFVIRAPAATIGLVRALRAAGALCAQPARRDALAALLAGPENLDLPAPLIEQALDPDTGGPIFTRQYPSPEEAAWFTAQMQLWRKAGPEIADTVSRLYRPDLFLAAGGAAS